MAGDTAENRPERAISVLPSKLALMNPSDPARDLADRPEAGLQLLDRLCSSFLAASVRRTLGEGERPLMVRVLFGEGSERLGGPLPNVNFPLSGKVTMRALVTIALPKMDQSCY